MRGTEIKFLHMTEHKFNTLLARIRAGDMSALEPIYTEYHRKMSVDAAYILGESDGEDAASAAIVKLIDYANKDSKRIKTPDAFMRTLVKNTAIDMLRARKPFAELEKAEDIPSPHDRPDEAAERNGVMLAIGQLPEQEREIAVMFYIYGIKIKSIAETLDMPIGTVKWHLSQIRVKLSEKLS